MCSRAQPLQVLVSWFRIAAPVCISVCIPGSSCYKTKMPPQDVTPDASILPHKHCSSSDTLILGWAAQYDFCACLPSCQLSRLLEGVHQALCVRQSCRISDHALAGRPCSPFWGHWLLPYPLKLPLKLTNPLRQPKTATEPWTISCTCWSLKARLQGPLRDPLQKANKLSAARTNHLRCLLKPAHCLPACELISKVRDPQLTTC